MVYGYPLTRLNPCDPRLLALLLERRVDRDARVADIGCGGGTTLAWLSKHSGYVLSGAEPDADLVAAARENCPTAAFVRAGAEALPFHDGAFDAALMECVFSLLEEPVAAVSEAKRIVRPGGVFVLTDLYARVKEDLSFKQNALLRHIYSRQTIEAFFGGAGFTLDGFIDRTADMGSLIAQMIMDGAELDCVDEETVKYLRRAEACYGIWIWGRT